jgi:hypothetical protein
MQCIRGLNMNFIDKYELDRWSEIRRGGKLLYIVRWIAYSIIFVTLTRVSIYIFNGKSFTADDVLPMLSVSICFGLIASLLRWKILDNKYQRNNS